MRAHARTAIGLCGMLLVGACGQGQPSDTPASTPTASLPPEFVEYAESVGTQLDRFWAETALAGAGYEPPSVEPYRAGELPASVCAEGTEPEVWRDTAYYCFEDRVLTYDADWLNELFAEGPGMMTTILAHEWGHHVQVLTTVPDRSLQRELQADCLAGVFLSGPVRAAKESFELALDSVEGLVEAGNEEYRQSAWFDINEHGSPALRWASYFTGVLTFRDPAVCAGHATYVPRPPEQLGGFLVAHVPGVEYSSDDVGLSLTGAHANGRLESVPAAVMPPEDETPEAQLAAVFAPYAYPMVIQHMQVLEGGPEVGPAGQWLSASYVADAPDQPGALRLGVARLFRAENGEGLLVDSYVTDETQVDVEDPAVLALMGHAVHMAYAIETYLCMPGQSAEVGSPDYYFSCDIEVPDS